METVENQTSQDQSGKSADQQQPEPAITHYQLLSGSKPCNTQLRPIDIVTSDKAAVNCLKCLKYLGNKEQIESVVTADELQTEPEQVVEQEHGDIPMTKEQVEHVIKELHPIVVSAMEAIMVKQIMAEQEIISNRLGDIVDEFKETNRLFRLMVDLLEAK